jgi:carboxypeptidase family protein
VKKAAAVLIVLLFLPSSSPQGRTGSIAGETVLGGAARTPDPPTRVKPADSRACGAEVADESVVASAAGGLKDVIVYIDNPPAGTPAPARVKLTNRNCRFQPRVQTATVGSTLVVGNDDDILHNTHGYFEGGATFFNLGLPFRGIEVPKPLARAGMITFKCDAGHTWMRGFLLVLAHAFHAVTDASGRFRIPQVPAGSYRIKAWHERLGSQDASVTVVPDQEVPVRIEFK